MNYGASGLAPSANEFVPGQYYNRDASSNFQTDSELSSKANEWVPAASMSASQSTAGLNSMQDMSYALQEASTFSQEPAAGSEPMVEVYWNGTTIFVPESSTYVGEDGNLAYAGGDGDATPAVDGTGAAQDGVAAAVPEEQEGLQWAQFASTLPAPPKRNLQTIGIPEPVRSHFRSVDIEALKQMNPENERYKELPMRYHSAYPLFNPHSSPAAGAAQGAGGSCLGYPTALYKAVDQMDSQLYTLRRFDNVRTSNNVVTNVAQRWHEVRHPGIVALYGIALEKGALFFSYMYHAGAQSLKERYIDQRGPLLGESLIWRLLIQLLSATRHVHGRGLAVRVVEPAHIILTSGTCARFSSVGLLDVLEFETRKSPAELQQDDLMKLGRVVLSLMTRAVITAKNTDDAIVLMKQHYSTDLQRVVHALLGGKLSIFQICNNQTVSDRIHEELDTAMAAADGLHSLLRNEYENGRVLRLLLKLGFVNERPADASNPMLPHWSETGDQYVLKLFRDHVFHQVDGDGLPILDAGHVLTALNKLDAGDPEEVLLSSRDGKDLLVVSYADVQRCLESSFLELSQQSQVALNNAAAAHTAGGNASSLPGASSHLPPTHSRGGAGGAGMGASMHSASYGGGRGTGGGGRGGGNMGMAESSYGARGGRNSTSSSNLMQMGGVAGPNVGAMTTGGMQASRAYNSVGNNLHQAGNTGAQQYGGGYGSGGGGNQGMYGGGGYSEASQYGASQQQGYSGGGAGYGNSAGSGRYSGYGVGAGGGGGYGGSY